MTLVWRILVASMPAIPVLVAAAWIAFLPPGGVAILLGPRPALAQTPAEGERGDAVDYAVRRGLDFLARRQNDDGSWTEKIGRKVHMDYKGTEGKHVGVTALACMAFMSNGSLPGCGKYGAEVEKGLDFILKNVQQNGFITHDNSRMYSHAFATLFLAEVYGTTGMENVREKLKLAIGLIVKAQNSQGGWRYQPGSQDADMSITVCQVMALRAARNAGIHVPKETIDAAIKYVKESYVSKVGAYYYQLTDLPGGLTQRSRYSFALTAAGVTALYGAGEYSGDYIDDGLEFMRRNAPRASEAEDSFDYYYGMYYGSQAAFQKGGEYWDRWKDTHWDGILRLQDRSKGCWTDKVGSAYATAMACIILQIPYQYLPIFER